MERTKGVFFRFIVLALIAVLVFSAVKIFQIFYDSQHTDQLQREVVGIRDAAKTSDAVPPKVAMPGVSSDTESILPETAALQAVNPDYIGWLEVPDTDISFPVVQTDNDSHYLYTDFYGKRWKRGTIFASAFSENPVVLFGHHEDMFEDLEKYKDRDFLANHLSIYLSDLYEQKRYQISAVYYFQNRQDLNGDGEADYDDYFGVDDPVAFLEFLKTYKNTIYLDPQLDVDATSKFLSLQTCTYEMAGVPLYDSFLVVMAIEQPLAVD